MLDPVLEWPGQRLNLRGPVCSRPHSTCCWDASSCCSTWTSASPRRLRPRSTTPCSVSSVPGTRVPARDPAARRPALLLLSAAAGRGGRRLLWRAGARAGGDRVARADPAGGAAASTRPRTAAERCRCRATSGRDRVVSPGRPRGTETGPPPAALPALQPDITFSEDFVIVSFVKPIYPEQALKRKISANVVVAMHVERRRRHRRAARGASRVGSARLDRRIRTDGPRRACGSGGFGAPAGSDRSRGWWFTIPIEYRPTTRISPGCRACKDCAGKRCAAAALSGCRSTPLPVPAAVPQIVWWRLERAATPAASAPLVPARIRASASLPFWLSGLSSTDFSYIRVAPSVSPASAAPRRGCRRRSTTRGRARR